MVRPAIGTVIVAAALAMAGQAAAELPMSPVYRTEQATPAGQSPPGNGEHAKPADAAGRETPAQAPQAAAPAPQKHGPAATTDDAKAADSQKVVATAPIPPPAPPSLPAPPAAEPAAPPPPSLPSEHAAAAPPRKPHRAPRQHYAYSHYPYLYRSYSAWGAATPPHVGPNPYSPNGGY